MEGRYRVRATQRLAARPIQPRVIDLSHPSSSDGTSAVLARSELALREKASRRGHAKSRGGCFNCKRRRIKCQETRPECRHCVKNGLVCKYAVESLVAYQPRHHVALFTMQDMRLFQHYLQNCYPNRPANNDSIWQHEIPCLSQNHEYLMHALLALAASDLSEHDPSLKPAAMAHRLKAIKAVKRSLAVGHKGGTFEEGNALMATTFALAYQSMALPDGVADFMAFCRGSVILAIQMYTRQTKFIFENILEDQTVEFMRPRIEPLDPTPQIWGDLAVSSLQALEPLCKNTVERKFYELLLPVAQMSTISSYTAYQLLTAHYGWWMAYVTNDEFAYMTDPNNMTCMILAAHWVALQQTMGKITQAMYGIRLVGTPIVGEAETTHDTIKWLHGWLKNLNRQVKPSYRKYIEWTLWVEHMLEEDITYFGGRTVLRDNQGGRINAPLPSSSEPISA